jgi:hypothetical protein
MIHRRWVVAQAGSFPANNVWQRCDFAIVDFVAGFCLLMVAVSGEVSSRRPEGLRYGRRDACATGGGGPDLKKVFWLNWA